MATQGTYNGQIYFSLNGGLSWSVSDSPAIGYYSIAGSSASGQYLIAAGVSNNALYLSTNYGQNWTVPTTPRPNPSYVAVSSTGQYMIYSQSFTQNACLTYSSDFGSSWSNIGPNGSCGPAAISPTGDFIVFNMKNIGLYSSTDGGTTFTLQYPTTSSFVSILYAATGSVFYAGMSTSPYSILRSTDNGSKWSTVSGTVNNTNQIYSFSVDSSGDNILAVIDFNLYFSTDAGNSFTQIDDTPSTSSDCVLNGQGNFCLYNYGTTYPNTYVYSANPSKSLLPL